MAGQQARKEVIAEAAQIVDQPYVVLDTETTGLSAGSEIVDIGIVDHKGQVMLDSLVRPLHPIPIGATAIHGITDEMVTDAPTWIQLWPKIEDALRGVELGIYNEEFDVKMLKMTSMLNAIPWQAPFRSSFCIMKMFSKFHGEWNDYFNDYRWQKLEFAGRELGIDLQNTHRAIDDALLSREVLLKMAQS